MVAPARKIVRQEDVHVTEWRFLAEPGVTTVLDGPANVRVSLPLQKKRKSLNLRLKCWMTEAQKENRIQSWRWSF